MKTLPIIALCVLLQGCVYQSVNQYDIYRAVYFCGGAERVVEVKAFIDGAELVRCRNGNTRWMKDIDVPEEK